MISAWLNALQAIADVELARLPLNEMLRETLVCLRSALPIDEAVILLATPDGQQFVESAMVDHAGAPGDEAGVSLDADAMARIATSAQPVALDQAFLASVAKLILGGEVRSALGARLCVEDRVLGVMLVGTHQPRRYSQDQRQLVRLVADRTALAIERARLYVVERATRAEAERAHERFAFLADAGSTLATSLDYDETLDQLAHLVVPRLADWCFIDILEEDGTLQHLVVAHRNPEKVRLLDALRRRYPPEMITFDPVPLVLQTGQSVLAGDITDEMLVALNAGGPGEVLETARQLGFRSGICVPLLARERIVGALSIVAAESERRYDMDDLALAEDLARRAGNAIDNARLYRQAQRALRRLEEVADELRTQATQLSAIIQAMPGAVCVSNVSGTITRINAAAALLFGLSPDEIVPPIPLDAVLQNAFFPDGTPLPPDEHPLSQALSGRTSTDYRFMMRRYDTNEEIHLLTTFAPIRDEMGRINGAVAAANDITRTYQLERQKDEFLSIASHELKTPLTSLKILVQLTYRRLRRANSPEAETIVGMERSIGRMERLVNDLLDVTRINAGKLDMRLEVCDLCQLCRQIVEEQSAASERSITLEVPEAPLLVEVDAERISQVLINLLSNALKYSPTSCPITLRLREWGGHQARICVRDEGAGIPPEAQANLFQRFYRIPGVQVLNGSELGLGLGLYISREIVERHGGRIWVESDVGAGAAFCFTLPLRDEAPSAAPSAAQGCASPAAASAAEEHVVR